MIAYNPCGFDIPKIMSFYYVSEEVAFYLDMIYPEENVDWEEYEEIKDFLSEVCESSKEFEGANKCLIDRLSI